MDDTLISSRRSLHQLLADWATVVAGTDHPQPPAYTGPDLRLSQLTDDSRQVQPGGAFFARTRTTGDGRLWSDGHRWIPHAVAGGARLIVGERPVTGLETALPADVFYLPVADASLALAWLAAAWHRFPARQLVLIGVTGTDGKSSTVQLVHAVLRAAGWRAGMLSTIRAVIDRQEEPLALHVTTPEAPVVQAYLRRMVDAGVTHCVLETTSHSLAQHRVAAVDFDVAVVTNITHEHLDYHGTAAAYFAAKARLFQLLSRAAWQIPSANPDKQQLVRAAVLNQDDASFSPLAALPAPRRLTYGLHRPSSDDAAAHLTATEIEAATRRTRFTLEIASAGGPSQRVKVTSPLLGEFNVYNMLAAAAVGVALAVPPATVAAGLEAVPAISGRMERIDHDQPFQVFVDFAHTPVSLEQAIQTARGLSPGRIIVVFGSAGLRDVAKRRLMATLAAERADLVVLTAEDPRTESLDDILATMAAACREQGGIEGATFWRIPDRGRAIYHALSLARHGDLVLVCGKGHEQSMCFGDTEFPWDDREATRAALAAWQQRRPMVDLGLPTFAAGPSPPA